MPIPNLQANGLLPQGIHDCSFEEINFSFAWNGHRKNLLSRFSSFLDDELRQDFPYPIYFDGSFVTDKPTPEDTDVVLDLTNAPDDKKWQGLNYLLKNQERIKKDYDVHFWVNLPGENDFATFFQYVGIKTAQQKGIDPKQTKGILRIL